MQNPMGPLFLQTEAWFCSVCQKWPTFSVFLEVSTGPMPQFWYKQNSEVEEPEVASIFWKKSIAMAHHTCSCYWSWKWFWCRSNKNCPMVWRQQTCKKSCREDKNKNQTSKSMETGPIIKNHQQQQHLQHRVAEPLPIVIFYRIPVTGKKKEKSFLLGFNSPSFVLLVAAYWLLVTRWKVSEKHVNFETQ